MPTYKKSPYAKFLDKTQEKITQREITYLRTRLQSKLTNEEWTCIRLAIGSAWASGLNCPDIEDFDKETK